MHHFRLPSVWRFKAFIYTFFFNLEQCLCENNFFFNRLRMKRVRDFSCLLNIPEIKIFKLCLVSSSSEKKKSQKNIFKNNNFVHFSFQLYRLN